MRRSFFGLRWFDAVVVAVVVAAVIFKW